MNTRRIFPLLAFLLLAFSASAADYNVRDYGAKGDGSTLDTKAINDAIDAASAQGGGRVVLTAGRYQSGSIHMKSNVELHLELGAVLVATKDTAAYDELEPFDHPQYQDGGHTFFHNSLIWAEGQSNIAITGLGTIDGEGLTRRDTKHGERKHDVGDKAIAFKLCRGVTLRDFTIYRGGHFAIILTGCDIGTLDNLVIDTNRDGVDLDCCKFFTMTNCKVNSPFDDGIVVKASYALNKPVASENITVTGCTVSGYKLGTLLDGTYQPHPGGGATGRIKLGTESNGGYRNIAVSNCTLIDSRGLAFEEVDQGRMENVVVSNISMTRVNHYAIYITTGRRNRGPKENTDVSLGSDIYINNVVALDCDTMAGIIVTGMPGHPLRNIRLSNIYCQYRGGAKAYPKGKSYPEQGTVYPEPKFAGNTPSYGLYARHVDGLYADGVKFSLMSPDGRPAVLTEDVSDCHLNIQYPKN